MTFRFKIAATTLLILAVALVYFPVLGFEFLSWDDRVLVYDNPLVLEFSMQSIRRAFSTFDPELYIPLTLVSYQIEHLLFGLNPTVFHLTNVVLHAVNAVMVFWLVWIITAAKNSSTGSGDAGRSQFISLFAALLFAIHPLNVEAVAWISARKDLLATFFALATALMYLQWRDRRRLRLYVVSCALFLCALFSKVSAAPLPFVLLLFEALPGRNFRNRNPIMPLVPFAVFSTVFVVVALFGKEANVAALTPFQSVLLWCRGVMFALQQFLLPFNLSLLYPYTKPIAATSFGLVLSTIVVAIVVSAIVALWRRLPKACFGIAFFLIALLPMLAVHVRGGEVYLFADRHLYLPMVGIAIAVAAIFEALLRGVLSSVKHIIVGLAIVVVVALGILSHNRTLAWHDNEGLYLETLESHPKLTMITFNLGLLYDNEHRYDEAMAVYEAILSEDPDYVKALNAYGYLLMRQGELEKSVAMLQRAVAVDSSYYRAWINLGRAYGEQGRYGEGIAAFQRAVEIDPRATAIEKDEVERLVKEIEFLILNFHSN